MAPRLGRGTTLHFDEMEEKGHEGFSPLIFTPVLGDFNIRPTRRVRPQMRNHQVIQNLYFKGYEGQSKTLD